MKNKEMLSKLNDLLGSEKQLMVIKGQLLNPEKRVKEDTGDIYYMFDIKTVQQRADDIYLQSYNIYHCILSSQVAVNYTDEQFSNEFKHNEVIVMVEPSNRIKTLKSANGSYKVNNVNYYVIDLMLTRQVSNLKTISKKIAL